jgi:hypothetical protein
VGILYNDPQMRTAFVNRVAAPVAGKLIDCGLIRWSHRDHEFNSADGTTLFREFDLRRRRVL